MEIERSVQIDCLYTTHILRRATTVIYAVVSLVSFAAATSINSSVLFCAGLYNIRSD